MIIRRLLYVLYLFVFVFLAFEVICRVGLLANNRYSINADLNRRKGAVNVLVLGDSSSVETPISATTLLKDYFARQGVSTLNLAGGGFGPREYVSRLESYGIHYSPRVILLDYYVGNDITDTLYRELTAGPLKRFLSDWLRESYFLGKILDLRGYRREMARLHAAEKQVARDPEASGILNPLLLEMARAHPDYITKNLLLEDEDAKRAWQTNKALIQRIFEDGKKHNAKMLLSIFPATAQVNRSHFDFYQKLGFTVDERTLTENRPQDLMMDLCKQEGWNCLDLLPAFREEGKSKALYLVNDDHMDEDGNQLTFRYMAAEIERLGLLR